MLEQRDGKQEEGKEHYQNDFFEFIIRLSLILTTIYALDRIDYNIIDNFSDNYKEIGKTQYYIEKIFEFYK